MCRSTDAASSSCPPTKAKKPSLGRRKIDIKKIEKVAARQTCFSKRRSGLFKKAFELSILCDAETAVVVSSPAGRVFSFAHPCVETVADRFFSASSCEQPAPPPTAELRAATEQRRRYEELLRLVEAEKRKKKEEEERATGATPPGNAGVRWWWDMDVDELTPEELVEYRAALVELQQEVVRRADEAAAAAFSPSKYLVDDPAPEAVFP